MKRWGSGSIHRRGGGQVRRPQPNWAAVHRELRRLGVTLQLLWEELAPSTRMATAIAATASSTAPGRHGCRRPCGKATCRRASSDYAGKTLEVIDAIDRRGDDGAAVRRRAWGVELPLCRSHLDAGLSDWMARTRAPSPSWAECRRWWCPTICARASPRPASTSRRSTAATSRDSPRRHRHCAGAAVSGAGQRPKSKLRFKSRLAYIITKLRNRALDYRVEIGKRYFSKLPHSTAREGWAGITARRDRSLPPRQAKGSSAQAGPRGSTGTSRARCCVTIWALRDAARVPPVDYGVGPAASLDAAFKHEISNASDGAVTLDNQSCH